VAGFYLRSDGTGLIDQAVTSQLVTPTCDDVETAEYLAFNYPSVS
jgi:hypothetical protein